MANEEEYEIDEEQRGLRHVGRGPLAEKGTQTPALVGELVSALNRMFPPADAEPWDRTGLLVGDHFGKNRRRGLRARPYGVCRSRSRAARRERARDASSCVSRRSR